MATSSAKNDKSAQDEVDEIFAQDQQEKAADEWADLDDLLEGVEDDDSEGWVPSEPGEGVAGKVIKVGEIRSDFAANDEDAMCPVVTIETKTGDKYRIIGYGAVLKRELQDKDPKVGDLLAVKYTGEGVLRKGRFQGKKYKKFGVGLIRAKA
jgi:hypothetical protein